jgi:hypothetical protein
VNKCPECQSKTTGLTEIGMKNLRIVGDSPTGYAWKVLTVAVPTAVISCKKCDWELHGYVHEERFVTEEQGELVL